MPISIDRAFHRVKEAFSIGELVSRSMMDFPSSSKKYFVVEEPFDVMNLHARFYQRFYSRFYGQTVPSISFLSPNFPPLCTCRENIEEIDRKNRGNSIKISRKRRGFLFVSFPSFFFSFHPYTSKSLLSSRGSRRCPTRRFSFRIVSCI